jgi:septal ring factor EnvC (AmiA/AmiB activator)
MLLAAFTHFLSQSFAAIILELLAASFVAYGLFSYLKNVNVRSQLAAKDAIIATNQQTIEAFEDRLNSLDEKVAALESDLAEARGENNSLIEELRDWENKYKHLENFAAPALGERLINMFERQEDVLDKIVNALEGIQDRIDALEGKSE